jgi:ribosome-binding protein aMBF1 (putative translation factor)
LCDICDYRGRDKAQFEEHRKTHFRCELCGKRFREQDDLVKHSQVHIKVVCEECKEEIQEDKMEMHRMNHMKLNRFNKTKSTIPSKKEKTPKVVSGYILWQKEERKKIAQEHSGMTASEISSELGKRWKIVDRKTKSQFQKKATEENNKNKAETVVIEDEDTLTSVVDNEEILLQEDYSEDQTVITSYVSQPETLTRKPTQNKLTNKNSATQDNNCPWCEYESSTTS